MIFYHGLKRFQTLAAIRLIPARARFINFTNATPLAFGFHVLFGFFVAERVA
jgi:hypothetical protein